MKKFEEDLNHTVFIDNIHKLPKDEKTRSMLGYMLKETKTKMVS